MDQLKRKSPKFIDGISSSENSDQTAPSGLQRLTKCMCLNIQDKYGNSYLH